MKEKGEAKKNKRNGNIKLLAVSVAVVERKSGMESNKIII